MKKLLVMLIFSICAIGMRSADYLQTLGIGEGAPSATSFSPEPTSSASIGNASHPISAAEFAKLVKTDPAAYQKYLASHQDQERNQIDKLMSFFTNGKYE